MNRGIVLLVALWVLIILSMLALGLGFRSSIDLRLVKYQKDSLSALNLAKAGIQAAIYEKLSDFMAGKGGFKNVDNFTEAWASNSESFKQIRLGNGEFNVSYAVSDNPDEVIYGMIDEFSKINLNAVSEDVLNNFFNLFDILISDAETLSKAIIDYRGNKPSNTFESMEELLLIDGFKEEFLYGMDTDGDGSIDQEGIKDYVTTYTNDSKVNINTASLKVITVMVGNNVDLANRITFHTRGSDDLIGTEDDSYFAQNKDEGMPDTVINLLGVRPEQFNEAEWTLMNSNFNVKSDIYRIKSQGKSGRVAKAIECVVDFSKLLTENKVTYLYWHEY